MVAILVELSELNWVIAFEPSVNEIFLFVNVWIEFKLTTVSATSKKLIVLPAAVLKLLLINCGVDNTLFDNVWLDDKLTIVSVIFSNVMFWPVEVLIILFNNVGLFNVLFINVWTEFKLTTWEPAENKSSKYNFRCKIK